MSPRPPTGGSSGGRSAGRGGAKGGRPSGKGGGAPERASRGGGRGAGSSGRGAAPPGKTPRGGAKGGRPSGKGAAASSQGPRGGGKGGAPSPKAPRGAASRGSRGGAGARGRSSAGSAGSRRQAAPKGLGGEQVEGRQAVRELLLAGRRTVHEVLMEADLAHATVLDEIIELAAASHVPLQRVAATKLRSMAHTEAPQGVVATAEPLPELDLDDLAGPDHPGAPRPPFLLVFDGVTDPGNLGAALRSAEGAGVTGVVLPRHRAVHVTPTVTKAAAGAVEHIPMALVGGVPAALERAKELGLWVVGLDAAGDREVYDLGVDAEPVALVLGAEGRGLSRLVRARCDLLARIPLRGALASLNVSAATAVACFEVQRQRDAAAGPGTGRR